MRLEIILAGEGAGQTLFTVCILNSKLNKNSWHLSQHPASGNQKDNLLKKSRKLSDFRRLGAVKYVKHSYPIRIP